MKKILIISLFLVACSDEPDYMFDVEMCEAQGGVATVNDVYTHSEIYCDFPEEEHKESVCYAICKPYGDCPQVDCPEVDA